MKRIILLIILVALVLPSIASAVKCDGCKVEKSIFDKFCQNCGNSKEFKSKQDKIDYWLSQKYSDEGFMDDLIRFVGRPDSSRDCNDCGYGKTKWLEYRVKTNNNEIRVYEIGFTTSGFNSSPRSAGQPGRWVGHGVDIIPICSNCSAELQKNVNFCNGCGNKVKK